MKGIKSEIIIRNWFFSKFNNSLSNIFWKMIIWHLSIFIYEIFMFLNLYLYVSLCDTVILIRNNLLSAVNKKTYFFLKYVFIIKILFFHQY